MTFDIAYCGLTHLGLISAVAAAAKGARVLGFDPAADLIAALDQGAPPIREPGLDEALAEHRQRLTFTADASLLASCDVACISTDVPTDDAGQSDLAVVAKLLDRVIPELPGTTILTVLSQVPPGFTRAVAFDPGRLFYQVETLVFGQALLRALQPERFIVGCADPDAGLPPAYGNFLGRFGCPILPMSYESAELAKIAINCVLVAQVSATNTLAELCENVGARWHEIAPALRLDRRIGQHAYLAPGLGLAGGNLERDLASVLHLAEQAGSHDAVVRAWIDSSRRCRDWVLRRLHRTVLAGRPVARVAILGLTYKRDTDSARNSAALQLIEALGDVPMRCYDPQIPLPAVRAQGAVQAADALDAARDADAVAIMTPWPAFKRLDPASLAAIMAGKELIDPYGVMDRAAVEAAGLTHHRLGVG